MLILCYLKLISMSLLFRDVQVLVQNFRALPRSLLAHFLLFYCWHRFLLLTFIVSQYLESRIPRVNQFHAKHKWLCCFFCTSAFEIMCVSVMQIFWSLMLFTAFDERKWIYLPLAYGTHLCVAVLVSLLLSRSLFPAYSSVSSPLNTSNVLHKLVSTILYSSVDDQNKYLQKWQSVACEFWPLHEALHDYAVRNLGW